MKRWLPISILLLALAWMLYGLVPPRTKNAFDVHSFASIPTLAGGRVKPMDTVARNSLMAIHGKQSLRVKDHPTLSASEWFAEVLFDPITADTRKVFLIHNSEVLGVIGKKQEDEKYFSFADLEPHIGDIEKQGDAAASVESQARTPFQNQMTKLHQAVLLYHRLKNSIQMEGSHDYPAELQDYLKAIDPAMKAAAEGRDGKPHDEQALKNIVPFLQRYGLLDKKAWIHPIPPSKPENFEQQWETMGESLTRTIQTRSIHPMAAAYAEMTDAWQKKDAARFNQNVTVCHTHLDDIHTPHLQKIHFEVIFNHHEPFYRCMVLYVAIFILAWISWLTRPDVFGKTAFYLLFLTLVVHTIGLASRMYLQGRPPVTNLYSSAVFVGWAAVLFSLFLERWFRNGIASVTGSTMGFLTLLIAHHLSGDGDTIEIMRAVLDSNFWLSTHVVVITLGYSAGFLAGFLAIIWILRTAFQENFSESISKNLESMVYGIICFATLFSFTGTVLGGIWADQSWGRFWGWDPKENGALLIVVWNAIILHARLGKFIARRGLMVLAIFGNIITSFSWFGVNMLGVGLHSYGFMDKAFFWLALFIGSQVLLMLIGLFFIQNPEERTARPIIRNPHTGKKNAS